ncbi:hypothetical protein, partial [Aeromonas dhakensis]|uniref:hypothetical protein n=1 Tax=Aeromonas dhakensis TaxID=196024 RepID=UPI0029DDE167
GRSGTPPQVRGAYYQIFALCEPLAGISGDKKVSFGHFLIFVAHFSRLSTTSLLLSGIDHDGGEARCRTSRLPSGSVLY